MRDWSAERVVIIGAARQGTALAGFLLKHGAQVVVNDQRSYHELVEAQEALRNYAHDSHLEWVCEGHPIDLLEGATLVCPSGGVPLTLPLVVEAVKRGIPLSNDSQIFLEEAPCKVIGITGSAGKTTTTALVGRMAQCAVQSTALKTPGGQAWVGGNIGAPLIREIGKMHPDDYAVMELSSFQLEIMTRSPQVAALINITPNHLDRHGTMQKYRSAKMRILEFQTEIDDAVLGRDDPGAWSLADKVRGRLSSFGLTSLAKGQFGTELRHGAVYLRPFKESINSNPGSKEGEELFETPVIARDEILLRGEHNLLNVLAACCIAAAAGIPVEAMKAGVKGFRGIPHRLEFVRRWSDADWYNDSIATSPERAMAAIRSFDEPLVLLAGGRDKQLPWEDFASLVKQRVDHLILFGEAANKILEALQLSGTERLTLAHALNLHEAVAFAAAIVKPGDVVLLSPGGTSFDEFKDFEERGECFARWVNELA